MDPDKSNNGSNRQPVPEKGAAKFTRREKEIVRLVIAGEKNRLIAGRLFISIRTVQNHRYRLSQKIDSHSAVELMHWAIRNGLAGERGGEDEG